MLKSLAWVREALSELERASIYLIFTDWKGDDLCKTACSRSLSLFVCVCVLLLVYAHMCGRVCTCIETKRGHGALYLITICLVPSRQGPLLNLELASQLSHSHPPFSPFCSPPPNSNGVLAYTKPPFGFLHECRMFAPGPQACPAKVPAP